MTDPSPRTDSRAIDVTCPDLGKKYKQIQYNIYCSVVVYCCPKLYAAVLPAVEVMTVLTVPSFSSCTKLLTVNCKVMVNTVKMPF